MRADRHAPFRRLGGDREMDSLYSYWASDRPHGFGDAHVQISAIAPT